MQYLFNRNKIIDLCFVERYAFRWPESPRVYICWQHECIKLDASCCCYDCIFLQSMVCVKGLKSVHMQVKNQKRYWIGICFWFCRIFSDNFRDWIVTVNALWWHHFDPEIKQQWRHNIVEEIQKEKQTQQKIFTAKNVLASGENKVCIFTIIFRRAKLLTCY